MPAMLPSAASKAMTPAVRATTSTLVVTVTSVPPPPICVALPI
jgi:hypothetical protein